MSQFSILLFNPLAEQRPGLSRLDDVFYAEGRSSTERRAKIINLSAQCHERCLGVLSSGKLCLECSLCSERESARARERKVVNRCMGRYRSRSLRWRSPTPPLRREYPLWALPCPDLVRV